MICVIASVLVPGFVTPVRAITTPRVIARRLQLAPGGVQRVDFDIVPTHIAFAWPGSARSGVRFRTTAADGTVGAWTTAPHDHDASTPSHQYSAVLEVDRPRAIEWRATGHDAGMGPVTIDYLNTLDGPRVTTTIPASSDTASAAAHAPDIVTREEWGADESIKRTTGSCQRAFYPVKQLFVHHTAGTNFDKHPKATMRAIYWFHVKERGWCDIGYNFVIAPNGTIFEGRWARNYRPWEIHDSENVRGLGVTGAQVEDYNSGSLGISVMGNYSQISPPPPVRRSLAELLAWEVDRHGLHPTGTHRYRNPSSGLRARLPYIAGHRDAGSTDCPGDFLYRALPSVRNDTAAVMGAGKQTSKIQMTASTEAITYGTAVTFTGYLSQVDGSPLAGQEVRTYLREGTADWRDGPTVTTGPDGDFSFSDNPGANLILVGVFGGNDTLWGSESGNVTVKVAPAVALAAEGGTVDGSGVEHYPSGTTSITFDGSVTPPHPNYTMGIVISKLQSSGSYERLDTGSARLDGSGNFAFNWSVPATELGGGSYRAVAVFRKDDDHARAFSPAVSFVIDPQP